MGSQQAVGGRFAALVALVLAALLVATCGGPPAAPAPAPTPFTGQTAPPEAAGAPAGGQDPTACVESAAGMTIDKVVEAAGGTLAPGALASGPLARVLSPEQVQAVEACFAMLPVPGGVAGAPPGAPVPSGPPPGSTGPNAPAGSLRELMAQEKAALQATADRVRATSVIVGELSGGRFAAGGSGFVYSPDGLIMTNSHVLADIKGTPQVMFLDGQVVAAEPIGRITNLQPDVAVLRVRRSGLAVAELGDSDTVRYGDPLLAIAHPRGFGHWLATAGQAYGQASSGSERGLIKELYSSVPSAGGASGGPLFNAQGQVVGLLFAGSSGGEPAQVAPSSPLIVLRDPTQWSSIATRSRTTAVPIGDALGAARDIVTRGGDLPSWSSSDSLEHRLSGADLQIILSATQTAALPSDLTGSLDPIVSRSFPGLRVLAARPNLEGYLVTFSAFPPPGAVDLLLPIFSSVGAVPPEVAGSVPDRVVEAVATPPPASDDERVLALLRPLLPSIVHIAARTGDTVEQGTGSIISSDGYVLTNAHVIDEGDSFDVTLYDGRTLPARRVGLDADQTPDVGVLKVDATGLVPLALGDVASLRPGAAMYLIGHPADRGYWRISAGGHVETAQIQGFDQVLADLSFASGNSGGPLLNERGELIGVFHGTPPSIGDRGITPSDPAIVWGWHEFDQLFNSEDPRTQLAAAAAIDVAMGVAERIIQRQGNVP